MKDLQGTRSALQICGGLTVAPPQVVMMSSVHAVDDIRIVQKEARSIQNARISVAYVAATTHCVQESGGVRIIAVRRNANRFGRMVITASRVFIEAVRCRAKICHFHDPELMFFGILLKLLGRKVIYDVHEDLGSAILSKYYLPRRLRWVLAKGVRSIEWTASHFYDYVFAATPTIAKLFPPNKTFLVQNFPLAGELHRPSAISHAQRALLFAYVGGISRIRGATEMVNAISYVRKYPDVRLTMAGNFSPSALGGELQQLEGWKRVQHCGFLTRESVSNLLATSRAGLLLFHPEPNHINAQPNKLFEYMSAGLPVIASDFPLWRKIIKQFDCGLLVDPRDPAAIAAAMEWVIGNPTAAQNMGERGRQAVEQHFSWSSEEKTLLEIYSLLLKN